MAAVVNFSKQALHQRMCFRATLCNNIRNSFPSERPCKLGPNIMKIQQNGIHIRRRTQNKPFIKHRQYLTMSSTNDTGIEDSSPFSVSDLISQFYASINEKNLKQLDLCISDDCCFEDFSFPKPFQGKKEVMNFLKQLTSSMGQNIKFTIEHVYGGNELTAAVNWHLEWEDTQIPLTRGCSFYELSTDGGQGLLIKKARVMIESPIKPGGIVLTLFKGMTSLFDDFPKAAEWILKSPRVILKLTQSIYTKFLAPIINPVLSSYRKMWSCMARLIGLALNILLHVLKIIFK